MIAQLTIERFKSLRQLTLSCKRVNVFIGPPDTGKSNILEALYFLSRLGWGWALDQSLRLRPELGFDALFFHQFFDRPITIRLGLTATPPAQPPMDIVLTATITGQARRLDIGLQSGSGQRGHELGFGEPLPRHVFQELSWLRYYSFEGSQVWTYGTEWRPEATQLVLPPQGWNLLYIARHDNRVYDYLKDLLSSLNWKLRFDQGTKSFRLSEVRADEILDYNLDLLSDSLKRLFFYVTILRTSKGATLVLDEPDVYAFPPYPKTLGDLIAADTSNQYFLTTHNPYFLGSLVEKTPEEELAVFVCSRDEDGATNARPVPRDRLPLIVEHGASVFFNLAMLVG
jgi:hypothetical protein